MRIVTVEEHFWLPEMVGEIDPQAIVDRGYGSAGDIFSPPSVGTPLADIGEARVAAMDAAGVDVQVLSLGGPGADLLSMTRGPDWARRANDRLAGAVAAHPDRFAGFAHLPTSVPSACPVELERCVEELGFVGALVNGSTQGRFLDEPGYDGLLACAAQLGVPLFLHPGLPPAPVRESYYARLPGRFSQLISIAGWGWHADTAVHVLRLVLSGALDRNPRLKLMIGHMGEGLPAMLARFDQLFDHEAERLHLGSVSKTITERVYVGTSGFLTLPPFQLLFDTFGVDHLMLSADYPFGEMASTCDLLTKMPVSDEDREKIAFRNAERILKI